MNRPNLNRHSSSKPRRKNITGTVGPRTSAAFIIKSAQATLKEIEQYKMMQKPKYSPKRDAQTSLLRGSNANAVGSQVLDNVLNYRAKSALEEPITLSENHIFSSPVQNEQEPKRRVISGTLRSEGNQNEFQLYSFTENNSESKPKKSFIIRRKKTGSSELKRISFHSTSSRGTTRESDGGLSLTTEKKEDECSDKYLNYEITPTHEEEKKEVSLHDSVLQMSQYDNRESGVYSGRQRQLDRERNLEENDENNRMSPFYCKEEEDILEDDVILKKDKKVNFDVKLGEIVGEGACGQVYKALNMETGQFLAVKHIVITDLSDPSISGLESLCQEIAVYQKLEHQNIVRYLGAKQEDEDIYIYMEYMPGGSISSMLKQYGSFEENVIRKFTKQVVLGLDYLHSKGVIHRDIKGANIMSDGCGNVKLADFGAAKLMENYSHVGNSEICNSIKGSLFWMAPELLNQEKHGRKIDIWSLGCTIIEMATANHPWPNVKSYAELIFAVMTKKCPPIPDHLSECAKDFVKQCCQFDKKLRPLAKDLLKHPFLNYI